jgi:hypothetical protein
MLQVFWFCVGVLLICQAGFFIGRLSRVGSDSGFLIKTVEHVAMRLLGIYLLSQAAADVALVAVQHFEYLVNVGRFKTWFELPRQDAASAIGALTKTTFGLFLLFGVRRAQRSANWLRKAGRTWKLG